MNVYVFLAYSSYSCIVVGVPFLKALIDSISLSNHGAGSDDFNVLGHTFSVRHH